jgi:hypothetical protein
MCGLVFYGWLLPLGLAAALLLTRLGTRIPDDVVTACVSEGIGRYRHLQLRLAGGTGGDGLVLDYGDLRHLQCPRSGAVVGKRRGELMLRIDGLPTDHWLVALIKPALLMLVGVVPWLAGGLWLRRRYRRWLALHQGHEGAW